MSESYIEVELNHQPVELCKLLKIANLVGGGGEAKIVISEGYVLLNGEVEYQKRKKVYHEDVVEFNGELIQLIINDEMPEDLPEEHTHQANSKNATKQAKAKPSKKQNNNKSDIAKQETSLPAGPKKRKPIAF